MAGKTVGRGAPPRSAPGTVQVANGGQGCSIAGHLRKLEMCKSQAREQQVGLEGRVEPDTAEVPG